MKWFIRPAGNQKLQDLPIGAQFPTDQRWITRHAWADPFCMLDGSGWSQIFGQA
jgi:hypothetical protein